MNTSRSASQSSVQAQGAIFINAKKNRIEERSQKKTPHKNNLNNNTAFY